MLGISDSTIISRSELQKLKPASENRPEDILDIRMKLQGRKRS